MVFYKDVEYGFGGQNKRFLHVKCVSTRKSFPNQVEIGKDYLIDKDSFCIMVDGDAYADIYSFDTFKHIARMNICHFVGIDMEG